MRKYILSLFMAIMPSFLIAQDLVIDKTGKKIPCEIYKIDSVNLYVYIIKNDIQYDTYLSRKDVANYYYDYTYRKKELRDSIDIMSNYKKSLTIGFLQGGGSLIGVDYEVLIKKRLGLQLGAGIVGFGGGINLHFKPSIRSSFLSLQYWHQGLNETYVQSVIGPAIVLRAKRLVSFQIGLGFSMEKGLIWNSSMPQSPVILTYALGIYLPR